MSSEEIPDLSGFSMLELFRVEAEQHTAVLTEALMSLTGNAVLARGPAEPLMRASHSIKGAARIIGLDLVVGLAGAMEKVFVAVQEGRLKFGAAQAAALLEGVEWLYRVSVLNEAELPAFTASNGEEIDALALKFMKISKGQAVLSEPGGESPGLAAPSTPMTPENGVETARVVEEKKGSGSSAPEAPGVRRGAGAEVETPTTRAAIDMGDLSMLELYRAEAEQHTAALNEGLLALEHKPGDLGAIEPLMRAAHSIKGAARIVGIDLVVRLAHAMEDCFVAAQAGEVRLDSNSIDLMLQAVDLLVQASVVDDSAFVSWMTDHLSVVDVMVGQIEQVSKGQAAPPSRETISTGSEETAYPKELVEEAKILLGAAAPEKGAQAQETKLGESAPAKTPQVRPVSEPSYKSRGDDETKRVVRVSAENLNRVMALAGEALVEAKRFQPLIDQMHKLKRGQARLASALQWLEEVLPQTIARGEAAGPLSEIKQRAREVREVIADQVSHLEQYARRSDDISSRLYREAISSRMRPFGDACVGFPRLVRDVARQLGKKVKLEIIGEQTEVDRDILEKLEAPLSHMVRNSLDHGIEMPERRIEAGKSETGTIRIEARHSSGMLLITISDDGRGVNLEVLRIKIVEKQLTTADIARNLSDAELMDFLFLPGFSTASRVTELSGRGVGLDVVQSMAQQVGGVVRATSTMGKGMAFHLNMPITMSVIRAVAVEIAGEMYGFPLTRIDRVEIVPLKEVTSLESRQHFTREGKHIGLAPAAEVLGLESTPPVKDDLTVVVVSDRTSSYGLVVDRYFGEQDLVVLRLDPRLGKVPDISAAAIMEDGSPLLIIDVEDMARSIDKLLFGGRLATVQTRHSTGKAKVRKRILVVEDSMTVREVERKLLENRGYDVETAVDGADGWNAVRSGRDLYDLVISDVDMPRMNGIELVRSIKQDATLKQIPVLIVSYKDRDEDRMRGLEAGATAYLTKGSFHDQTLLNMVVDLIGEPDA